MAKNSQDFYKKLGAEGLAARKKEIHTKKELSYLKKFLKKNQKMLDLACGYGRFTIPLAKQGYEIEGLDISKNLLDEARKRAKKEKLDIKFRLGDMRKLPYRNNAFDAIICMWSAFIELPNKKDQIKALREMYRVLNKNGFTFLEMPEEKNAKGKAIISIIDGVDSTPMLGQNKKTMSQLMKQLNPSRYKVFIDSFGGRNRLLVIFWK
jgi:ubiquinone/menaquinone biosynthesis C-methylase UbiE